MDFLTDANAVVQFEPDSLPQLQIDADGTEAPILASIAHRRAHRLFVCLAQKLATEDYKEATWEGRRQLQYQRNPEL